jgi:hypothetical protein
VLFVYLHCVFAKKNCKKGANPSTKEVLVPLARCTLSDVVIATDSRVLRHVAPCIVVAPPAHYYSAPDRMLDAI